MMERTFSLLVDDRPLNLAVAQLQHLLHLTANFPEEVDRLTDNPSLASEVMLEQHGGDLYICLHPSARMKHLMIALRRGLNN